MAVLVAVLAAIVAIVSIAYILWEAFETIVLPRRVKRRLRLTSAIYALTWDPWTAVAERIRNNGQRESWLSAYGPLSLLLLLGAWAIALVFAFALLQWALGSHIIAAAQDKISFGTDIYLSGTTFFTLGLGDVVPVTPLARAVTVIEAGTGFAFLALVIGYLPTLYQSFSRREVSVTLLDARAGSPPTAAELLRRHTSGPRIEVLTDFLHDWEIWASELLESHLSYPSLAYFRSQHDNQSWLGALTAILDVCSLILVGIEGIPQEQARLTFAIARHAAVDLSQVFSARPNKDVYRLPADDLERLREVLMGAGVKLLQGEAADRHLRELRRLYEPYVASLSKQLLVPLPVWLPEEGATDDWKSSPFE